MFPHVDTVRLRTKVGAYTSGALEEMVNLRVWLTNQETKCIEAPFTETVMELSAQSFQFQLVRDALSKADELLLEHKRRMERGEIVMQRADYDCFLDVIARNGRIHRIAQTLTADLQAYGTRLHAVIAALEKK